MELVENGDIKSVPQCYSEDQQIERSRKKYFCKKRQINIRISEFDLRDLQIKAMEEGISYQTLISSILHKYVTGIVS